MLTNRHFFTPARVSLLAVCLPVLYVIFTGPERFYYESWGTWIVSPAIYTRISPAPLNGWLLRGFLNGQALLFISLAIPVVLLFCSAICALLSIGRNSLRFAFASLALVACVFTVYHLLQPLGVSYVSY